MSPYDWTENQVVPGVIINPGTGPVHGATHEQAKANIEVFVKELGLGLGNDILDLTIEDTGKEEEGRWTFVLHLHERSSEIDMPGLPLDEVRYTKDPDQDIFAFPRLYENGSSWLWCYALTCSAETLTGNEE